MILGRVWGVSCSRCGLVANLHDRVHSPECAPAQGGRGWSLYEAPDAIKVPRRTKPGLPFGPAPATHHSRPNLAHFCKVKQNRPILRNHPIANSKPTAKWGMHPAFGCGEHWGSTVHRLAIRSRVSTPGAKDVVMDRRLPRLWAFCLIWPVAWGCQSLHVAGLLGAFGPAV